MKAKSSKCFCKSRSISFLLWLFSTKLYTIKSMKCQHNPYLESIKTSLIHCRQKIREIPKSIIGKFWSIIAFMVMNFFNYVYIIPINMNCVRGN